MKTICKSIALALALCAATGAHAATTIVHHGDGSSSAVVTDDVSGQTEVYDNDGSGWELRSWHGEAHDHAEIVDRVTGGDDSVSDVPDHSGSEGE